MNKTLRYLGLLAILPLFMAIISFDYIDEAEAKLIRDKHVTLLEPVPDVDLTLKQLSEPLQSDDTSLKTTKGFVPKTSDSDSVTYRVNYIVSNSGTTDVKNIMISVHSDTEIVDAELSGWLDPKHSIISVLVKAVDPALIDAKIVGYEI